MRLLRTFYLLVESEMRVVSLVYPVLQAQTWNLAQMLEVARYQCGPARQGDAGYEQIGSSYLAQTALRPQLVKAPDRGLVKGDDEELSQ